MYSDVEYNEDTTPQETRVSLKVGREEVSFSPGISQKFDTPKNLTCKYPPVVIVLFVEETHDILVVEEPVPKGLST
jgi:hypothetical protein